KSPIFSPSVTRHRPALSSSLPGRPLLHRATISPSSSTIHPSSSLPGLMILNSRFNRTRKSQQASRKEEEVFLFLRERCSYDTSRAWRYFADVLVFSCNG
ncbi:hypothetical protein PDJAM_G00170840, partial [Pangasius djambal]|nr:hypothetical protein [Pangasius djambal]